MEKCIFCIKEPITDDKLISINTDYYVILDKFPISPGHLLIISKQHYENFLETPDSTISSMMKASKKFGILLQSVLSADGMKILTNINKVGDQSIMHTHIHIIPKYKNIDAYPSFKRRFEADNDYTLKIKSKLLERLTKN